jgi:E3 ubiquitin-protein ligase synoviolin
LTAIELYYREQWVEKGFVLNISRFIFDSLVLILNAKLFFWIFVRGQFPLYLLGESIDTLIKLYKSVQLFIKSRTIVNQLKRLPDVDLQNEANRVGVDTTCIICLEEMNVAKKLRCGHIFHLSCLRRWIEQNVQCPTCRTQIALDQPEARPPGTAPADEAEPENRRQGARQGRDVRLLLRQQGLIQRRRQQQQERDERIR